MNAQDNERLLTAEQVAAKLNIKPRTVARWAGTGKLDSVKLGPKCLRFDPRAVEELMNRSRQHQATA